MAPKDIASQRRLARSPFKTFVQVAAYAFLCELIIMVALHFAKLPSRLMPIVDAVLLVLLGLASLAVVTLIRVVGVILVIALLTIPAATAQQWAVNLRRMMIEAVLIGAFCTSSGLFLSYGLSNTYEINVPTGPLIILIAVAVYGASSAIHASLTRSSGV